MPDSLHVAFVTPEMGPFVKTGGLADISAALPKALVRLGHRVTVVLPRYASIGFPPGEFAGSVHVPVDGMPRSAGFYRTRTEAGVDVVFVEYPPSTTGRCSTGTTTTTACASDSSRARRSSTSAAEASGRASFTRTTGRPASCRVPEGLLLGRPDAARGAASSPSTTWPTRASSGRTPSASWGCRGTWEPRTRSSTTGDQLPEGRDRVRGAGQHRVPDLRPRDPGARARRSASTASCARAPATWWGSSTGSTTTSGTRARTGTSHGVLARGHVGQGRLQGRPAADVRAAGVPRPAPRRRRVAPGLAEGLRPGGRGVVGLPAEAAPDGGAGHRGPRRAGGAAPPPAARPRPLLGALRVRRGRGAQGDGRRPTSS